ncbi:MAG: glycosyltransferase family A protein [Lentisphaeria bacterium]
MAFPSSQPRLSIIVIAYNEEKYLPRTMASLSQQTKRDFEVIVVDSNSTDGTEAVARQYADKLPAFRYVKLSQTAGPAYGRNRGAEFAASSRLLFLDADTVLQPDFIAATRAELVKREADLATCPLRVIEKSMLSIVGAAFLNTAMRVFSPVYASAYGACLFSTREVHDAVGGFDERLGICEDCHYVKMARERGFRFRILRPVFYTSDRRARHEGSTRVMVKYLACHLRRMLTGREIQKEDIKYTYGDF